jgi:hypothetical protein
MQAERWGYDHGLLTFRFALRCPECDLVLRNVQRFRDHARQIEHG